MLAALQQATQKVPPNFTTTQLILTRSSARNHFPGESLDQPRGMLACRFSSRAVFDPV